MTLMICLLANASWSSFGISMLQIRERCLCLGVIVLVQLDKKVNTGDNEQLSCN